MTLYHYTCSCSEAEIRRTGLLLPGRALGADPAEIPREWAWQLDVIWLTDLDIPHRVALGLTMEIIACDRTEYRCVVGDAPAVVPWHRFARRLSSRQRTGLETGCRLPMHWWVSTEPVPVLSVAATATVVR